MLRCWCCTNFFVASKPCFETTHWHEHINETRCIRMSRTRCMLPCIFALFTFQAVVRHLPDISHILSSCEYYVSVSIVGSSQSSIHVDFERLYSSVSLHMGRPHSVALLGFMFRCHCVTSPAICSQAGHGARAIQHVSQIHSHQFKDSAK